MAKNQPEISTRTRVAVFVIIAGASALATLLLKFLSGFDWGVLYYGLASMLGLGLFLALFLGRPTVTNRWLSFIVISLTAAIAAAFLGIGQGIPLGRVLLFGWVDKKIHFITANFIFFLNSSPDLLNDLHRKWL